mmetsp:Transcript_7780/g.8916  ORF Transcript_7780/g.8916 Transcript_7780/m.8916 type:complete len:335 (-) Transcript_7780:157-1161(-)|eukprot:CAMPEP_0194169042 /NCGR_PEP_ID=MMETSP0154-20130528/3756_1 /TAXON_ID=1049557 /ORGANISM="Thalassiothrix antarctica, Strain L6-D1" /LENGTH=334 /DNA_ID=CAMNT_0038880273 /DNA_START=18 /DNA_END=1025 /DNA_ORIENTATION=+
MGKESKRKSTSKAIGYPDLEKTRTEDSCDDESIEELRTDDRDIIANLSLDIPHTKQEKKPFSLVSCLLMTICIICVLLVCVIGVSYYILGTPNPLKLFQNSENFLNIENQWASYGEKLELTIENALDDNWTPYLEEYVTKWDNGKPESLTLTISRVKVDNACKPSFGKLKVCNGDYGKTTWEGLNLSLVKGGYIRWSTSRMNDYFLSSGSEAAKKFTMCHELGHGFGLAHSDEDYTNRNRGDCMDYTHKPEGNLSTGRSNHITLKKVYGSSKKQSQNPTSASDSTKEIPEHIIDKYFGIEEQVKYSGESDEGSWIEDLGEGYHIVINKLLAVTN